MKKLKYTKQVLEQAVVHSYSISEVCRYINGNKKHLHGGLHNYISEKIKKFKIDTSHFKSISEILKECKLIPSNKRSAKELLVKNRKFIAHAHQIRRALFEIGRKYECELCGNKGIWKKSKLTLEIDHKNGIKKDDSPNNLRFLCPNCHSQTTNYRSNNRVE